MRISRPMAMHSRINWPKSSPSAWWPRPRSNPCRSRNWPDGGRTNRKAAERLHPQHAVFDDGRVVPTPRYDRARLLADDVISAPALIVQHNLHDVGASPDYFASVLSHGRSWPHRARRLRGTEMMHDTTAAIDPITLQVIGGALHSIAEQMGNDLYRMSYSSIIRESQDLGAGLFDYDSNTKCEFLI